MQCGGNGNNPQSLPMTAGRYYFVPPNSTSLSTSNAHGNGTLRASPFYVPNPISVTKIGTEVTSAGDANSKVRLGIYADDGTGRPGTLLVDGGQIAGDSAAVQEVTLGTPLALGPGWYWIAAAVQAAPTTQPTLRIIANNFVGWAVDLMSTMPSSSASTIGFLANSVTGALPSTFTVAGNVSTIARIFIKT